MATVRVCLLCAAIMGLCYGSLFPDARGLMEEREICTSKECEERARTILSYVDHEADPCEDFYSYACSKYIRSQPEEEVEGEVSRLENESSKLLKDIITNFPNDTEADNAIEKVLMLYQTCLHNPHTEEEEVEAIKEILLKYGYGSWPLLGNETMTKVFPDLKSLLSGTSLRHLFRIHAVGNPSNMKTFILRMAVGTEMALNWDEEIDGLYDSDSSEMWLEEVLEMAVRKFRRNAYHDDLVALVKDAIRIEMKLKRLEGKKYDVNTTEIKTIAEHLPSFPFLEILNNFLKDVNITLHYDDIMAIEDLSAFNDTVQYLLSEDVNSLYNYMGLHTALYLLDTSSETYRQETSRIYYRHKIDFPKYNRSEECSKIFHKAPSVLSRLFIQQKFDSRAQETARSVANSIGKSHYMNLLNIPWIDHVNRKAVLKQLWDMEPLIGYPNNFMNKTLIEWTFRLLYNYKRNSAYSTMLHWYEKNVAENNLLLVKDTSHAFDESPLEEANSHYDVAHNRIVIPASLLQGLIFNAALPKFLNLAASGFIISHEILHGFEYLGTALNTEGPYDDSWPYARKEFDEKADCFGEQMNSIREPLTNLSLNVWETLSETIADNGGIKVALQAFRQNQQNVPDIALPGLENFTSEQLFFISFALPWCSNYSLKTMQFLVKNEYHLPPKYRVNLPLQNMEDFSAAFYCKKGSAMRLPDRQRCVLW